MVKGGSMLLFRCNIVKLRNSAVDSIIDRFGKSFYFSLTGGAFFPSNGNARLVNNLSHGSLLYVAVLLYPALFDGYSSTLAMIAAFSMIDESGNRLRIQW
jgi:hypothetical protein